MIKIEAVVRDADRTQQMLWTLLFALMVIYIVARWQTVKEPSAPVCTGIFQGSGVFAPYVFTCTENACTYTQSGSPGTRPVMVYSMADGITVRAPALGAESWPYFNVVINCTDAVVSVQRSVPSTEVTSCVTLAPNAITLEGISDTDWREYTSVQSC
jgi:hypothetical protein